MDTVECPYCEKYVELWDDDIHEEDTTHERECNHCGKNFVFTTSILFSFESEKADCLNGFDHDWKISNTYPRAFSGMICSMCDKRRELTDDELKEFDVPTVKEYYDSLDKVEL